MQKPISEAPIIKVNYSELRSDLQNDIEHLILDHDLKIKQNIETGEYEAFLQLENPHKRILKNKPFPSSKQRMVTVQEFFSRKTSPLKEKKKTQETGLNNNRPLTHSTTINFKEGKILNPKKIIILQKFAVLFPKIDFQSSFFYPFYIQKHLFFRKLETIYNKQFELILRTNKMENLNLAKIIWGICESEMQENFALYQQNLVNLLYTLDKNSNLPEVSVFLGFLFAKPGNQDLLFYLFVRQILKIITGQFFLNQKQNEINPKEFKIKREDLLKIIEQAFYFDKDIYLKTRRIFFEKFANLKNMNYYDLLLFFMQLDLNFEVGLLVTRFIAQSTLVVR